MTKTTRHVILGLLFVICVGAQAQAPSAGLGTLGAFALLGDSVQVAAGQQATGSRLDPTQRESLAFTGIGFDAIALKVISEHMRRVQPAANVQLFQAPRGLTLEQQRAIATGAEKAQLPGWMVDTIEAKRLTHVLIVTRTRGPVDARTANNETIGRAEVDGIGFYLDREYQMQNIDTGAVSTGLIAPYVQVRLTLMDAASGDLLGRHDIRLAHAHAAAKNQIDADPWNFMTMDQKVRSLRGMVEKGIADAMTELVRPR
jgi:hypothetical protein